MQKMRDRMQWLSLVIIIGLLLQLLLPILPPPTAQAAPPAQEQGSLATVSHAAQLEQALVQLEEAADEDDLKKSLEHLESVWNDLLLADQQIGEELLALDKDLASRGLEVARDRLALLRTEYEDKIELLTAHYDELMKGAQEERQAVQSALESFRSALNANVPVPPTPDLERLPTRSVTKPSQIEHRPALSRATLTTARTQSDVLAVPAQGQSSTLADLASTEDAEITPEIEALAAELGHDPVAIYEYVRNKIAFEPYYGSHKGAQLTLWERSGNDIDTASLLIALLRASGYSARYVQGTVAIDEISARNWVGNASDLNTAGTILATGGVPVSISGDGRLIKEHVWVEVNTSVTLSNRIFLPLMISPKNRVNSADNSNTAVAVDEQVAGSKSDNNNQWVPLDASFKQFEYYEPTNLAGITGFEPEQWIEEVRAVTQIDDKQRSISSLPKVPSSDEPENSDYDREFVDVKAEEAVANMLQYIEANPQLTNADLLGGAYIITETVQTLPDSLPYLIMPDELVSEYSEVPDELRDYVTIELYTRFGNLDISHQASFASLANRRVTISYEAATSADQAAIDSYGGSLLTTPPVVNLVPVLRINGAEVARGSPAGMGRFQTRSLTFTDATGNSNTVQNTVRVGDTFAIGLGYGRSSATAIEASQQRLAAARAALPTNANGDPDVNAPGNMAEPVIGESLNLAMLAYFNQLDTYSELVARERQVRWFRYLSAGVATQNMIFGYLFGVPIRTKGGGMSFDIQQNVVGITSLQNEPNDERVFLQTVGYFSSALEHSLFENLGHGSVSTMRLLELALERGITVYRIDSSNKAEVFPQLRLSSSTENYIYNAVDEGMVVTVSEQEITAGDWNGVGFIVMNPTTGAAGYLISGGLAGNTDLISGGAIWDVLQEVAAYSLLAINLGLDLWGIWAGIGLILLPEPTLLSNVLGLTLIAASLVSLGLDIADLTDLVSGDLSASQYVGEQITGLIIGAILKRVGIAAAAEIVQRMGPDSVSRVVRQLNEVTGGAVERMLRNCRFNDKKEVHSSQDLTNREAWENNLLTSLYLGEQLSQVTGETSEQILGCFSEEELVNFSSRLTTREAWEAAENLTDQRGANITRQLVNNDYIAGKNAIERVARTIADAPNANGLDRTVEFAVNRQDFGYAYELQRAVANQNVVEYGRHTQVEFQRITGFDSNGNPTFGGTDIQALEGDLVLSGNVWVDAKHGAVGNRDLRIWNQIQKAQAAITAGQISGFRFEGSSSIGQRMRNWAATNAPDVQFAPNLGDGFP